MPETPQWTHRPTWPDKPESHATDRSVRYGENDVGRTYLIKGGPQDQKWSWGGYWIGTESGTADTLDAAVNLIRVAFLKEMERNPVAMQDMFEHRRAVKQMHADYEARRAAPPPDGEA